MKTKMIAMALLMLGSVAFANEPTPPPAGGEAPAEASATKEKKHKGKHGGHKRHKKGDEAGK